MKFRVAGYQMPVETDITVNTRRICSAISWASENRADILLTPEG